MSYSHSDDDGYSHSSQANVAKTADDVRHQYESNLRSLSNINFEVDEKTGDASILGITVPKNLKPGLELGLENVKPYILNLTKHAFTQTSKLATRIGFSKTHSNTVGLVAENALRWSVVGAKQIFDVISASNKYAKERKELFRVFAPVMQATNANIHTNEVLKVAYDDLHNDWLTDIKMMAADLPTLIPMVILGLQDQAAANAAHKIRFDAEKNVEAATVAATGQTVDPFEKQRLRHRAVQDEIEKQREKYVEDEISRRRAAANKENKAFDEDGVRSRAESYFDNNQADDYRKMLLGENDGKDNKLPGNVDEKTDNMMRWMVPLTSSLGLIFKSNFEDMASKRKKRVKAWKMIEHLRAEMETECGKINTRDGERSFTSKHADDIRIEGMGNHDRDRISLKDYIIDVFQQHERDREPSRNFVDKNGKLIDPLKGTLLTNLQPAVDLIAEHIAGGSLSTDALYKLVGENKIIMHSKFGARTFAKEDQVKDIIEKELVPVLSTREVIKLEEFTSKFADPALIQTTLKNNLENMKGTEKALFASLFPDDILEQAGIKKKEIIAIRKQAHELSYDFVAATAVYLAAQDPENLKKLGISDPEIQSISSLAEKVESGDLKSVKSAVDGRDKEALDAIRSAGLLEQAQGGEQGKQFWTERVKEMGAVHQKLREERADDMHSDDTRGGNESSFASKHKKKTNERFDGDESEEKWASDHNSDRYSDRLDSKKSWGSARESVRNSRESLTSDSADFHAL